MTDALAVVYFVDVGKGSSQLVLFPNNQAVLIDAGENSEPVERLIESLVIDRFVTVIVSHWHKDHCQGLPRLLRKYRDRIDTVRVPGKPGQSDGAATYSQVYEKVKELRWSGATEHYGLSTLEYDRGVNGLVCPVPTPSGDANLRIVYPDREDRDVAESGTDTNQASGILVLECGTTRVVFPGDAGQLAFERLGKRLGSALPVACDVLTAPHHAGKLGRGNDGPVGTYANSYQWLYAEMLAPKTVWIGTQTQQNAKHPRENHIEAIAGRGICVQCTQLTDQCSANPSSLAPGLLKRSIYPGRHATHGVSCMGTIAASVYRDRVEIERFDEHQHAIDTRLDPTIALCRRFNVPMSKGVT